MRKRKKEKLTKELEERKSKEDTKGNERHNNSKTKRLPLMYGLMFAASP